MAENFHKRKGSELKSASRRSRAHSLSRLVLSAAAATIVLGCQSLQQSQSTARPSPVISLSTTENQIFDLINQQREHNSIGPLTRNRALDSAARYQADNMARLKTMAHVLQGTSAPTFPERIRMVHYLYSRVAENIAHGQRTAQEAVSGWVASPPHRESIMDSRLTETGVAVARASNGGLYFCQVFGRPR